MKKSKHFSNTSLNKEVEIKSKILDRNDFTQLYEVEYGYCTDHPSRCKVGDCRFCEYYFFSPNNREQGLRWLSDCSQTLKLRMQEQIQLIIAISKNMEYSLKTLEYPLHKQEHLSTSANGLRRLMDQKAMVDAELGWGIMSPSRGRPTKISDEDLKQILLKYAAKHQGQKISPSQLKKDTGIKRHVWMRRMKSVLDQ